MSGNKTTKPITVYKFEHKDGYWYADYMYAIWPGDTRNVRADVLARCKRDYRYSHFARYSEISKIFEKLGVI